MSQFESLEKQIAISNKLHTKHVSTDADIARFEKLRGIILPDSYKWFAKTFGAGELGGWFRFPVPLGQALELDLATFYRETHGTPEDDLWSGYGSTEEIESWLFFCITGGSEWFGWCTDEKTDENKNEYAVHAFSRGPWHHVVSNSFVEFLKGCLRGDLKDFESDIESVFDRY